MYFDFEERRVDMPSLDSAMSWREQILMSLFAHLLVVAIAAVIPSLPFMREAQEARDLRIAEIAERQELTLPPMTAADDNRTFVFIEPLVDIEAEEFPLVDGPLSDRDRTAQSPTEAEDPLNQLPNADGNSLNFVESDDPTDGLDLEQSGLAADTGTSDSQDVVDSLTEELSGAARDADMAELLRDQDFLGQLSAKEFIAKAIKDGALTLPFDGKEYTDSVDTDVEVPIDDVLGRSMRNLERYARRESFSNRNGSTGRFGPSIQFDSKGIEFGPWIRRFVAQIRRNWFIPYVMMSRSMHGNVVLTFYVHRDGSISQLSVIKPASIQAFTNSAFNALSTSNPTQPLPPEYPDDQVFFTVTFYFNESPPV